MNTPLFGDRFRLERRRVNGVEIAVNRLYTPLADWQAKARGPVTGTATPGGHYISEETPDVFVEHARAFFVARA